MVSITFSCTIQLDCRVGDEEEIAQRVTDMNFVLSSLEYQPQIVGWDKPILLEPINDEEE